MATVSDLHTILDEYKKTPDAVGLGLRLDLAQILLRQMNAVGWDNEQLADAAGMREFTVTAILHSDMNLTFETAGRLLHALGIKPALMDVLEISQ